MRWTARRIALVACATALLLAPGWRADLVPVEHDELLAASRASPADRVFGVSLASDGASDLTAERWHAQYVDRTLPVVLHDLGVSAALPGLIAPDFAAHLPPGAERADAYYRVDASVHWPWWRSGGGVAWDVAPDR